MDVQTKKGILFDPKKLGDGSPKTQGGVKADFDAKINNLLQKILMLFSG
jgi:hypothetical protein